MTGDADRCLVDEYGNIIDGPNYVYIIHEGKNDLANNTVVTTIMSNMGLYEALDRKGISYENTT